ncbi:7957_t:CDS:1 [Scutellospora calospora]|uniref:7957_t:CDS:1 n=1 Tax=Scutellospora calospora TaxID=85575 RepID=A0ACA9KK43_9GLOM|nr:7957_t:CDS:1 [Scutellospora calospora]
MEKLSEQKINDIINQAISHWTRTFGTTNRNTNNTRVGLRNFIIMINNFYKIGQYGDGYIDNMRNTAMNNVQGILTNAYNKGIPYYAEGILHQVAHRTYQEIITLNKSKQQQLVNQVNNLTTQLNQVSNNIHINNELNQLKELVSSLDKKINEILVNLGIQFQNDETLNNKLDKIKGFMII